MFVIVATFSIMLGTTANVLPAVYKAKVFDSMEACQTFVKSKEFLAEQASFRKGLIEKIKAGRAGMNDKLAKPPSVTITNKCHEAKEAQAEEDKKQEDDGGV